MAKNTASLDMQDVVKTVTVELTLYKHRRTITRMRLANLIFRFGTWVAGYKGFLTKVVDDWPVVDRDDLAQGWPKDE